MLREDIAKLEAAYVAAMPEPRRARIVNEIAGSDFALLVSVRRYFEDMAHFREMQALEALSAQINEEQTNDQPTPTT